MKLETETNPLIRSECDGCVLVNRDEFQKRSLAMRMARQLGHPQASSGDALSFAWMVYRRVQILGRSSETEHVILENAALFQILLDLSSEYLELVIKDDADKTRRR